MTSIVTERTCAHCREIKPLSGFHASSAKKSSRAYVCKPCERKRVNDWWWSVEPATRLWKAARYRARKIGVIFTIEPSDVHIPEICPVLGIPIFFDKTLPVRHPAVPSLDRIIPALGYVPSNIIVISWRANMIKGSASVDELRKVTEFYDRLTKGENGE